MGRAGDLYRGSLPSLLLETHGLPSRILKTVPSIGEIDPPTPPDRSRRAVCPEPYSSAICLQVHRRACRSAS